MNPGYQNEHPMNMGYEVVANPCLRGQPTINIPRVQPSFRRQAQNQYPTNMGYQVVENPLLGGRQTINIPRVQRLAHRPAQMQRPRPQNSGASCEVCYDMNPRIQPESRIRLDPNEIKIYLWEFLRASDECPFCNLLLRIFRKYVDGAEEKMRLAERKAKRSLHDPLASVVVESDRPVVITFREGMHAGASVARDAIVSGEENDPRKVYYPPPIQVYCPAGNVAPSYSSIYADMKCQQASRY